MRDVSIFDFYRQKEPNISLVLPFPVSVNAAYGNVTQSDTPQIKGAPRGRFKTKTYRAWLTAARNTLWTQRKFFIDKPVIVIYHLSRHTDSRVRDCANFEKVLSDFLKANQILADDSLIEMNIQRWTNTITDSVLCEIFVI